MAKKNGTGHSNQTNERGVSRRDFVMSGATAGLGAAALLQPDTGEAQRVSYARLTSGITFDLEGARDAVLDRWRQQIEHLKKTAGASPGR